MLTDCMGVLLLQYCKQFSVVLLVSGAASPCIHVLMRMLVSLPQILNYFQTKCQVITCCMVGHACAWQRNKEPFSSVTA